MTDAHLELERVPLFVRAMSIRRDCLIFRVDTTMF